MKKGVSELIKKHGLSDIVTFSGLPAHAGVTFEDSGSLSYLDMQSLYSQAMLQNGILIYAFYFLNAYHRENEIRTYLDATDKAFDMIRKAVDADSTDGILTGGKVDPVFKRNIK